MGGCGREAGRYGERYDPFLHLSRGHYYTAQPCSGNLRHLPSLLTITCHFVSLLTVSSAHTKTKKPMSVNLCSAQLISAHLRRAHGQKTNKKTGPRSECTLVTLILNPNHSLLSNKQNDTILTQHDCTSQKTSFPFK